MKEFCRFHPVVNALYFLFAIALACLIMHPVGLVVSLACSFSFYILMTGAKGFRYLAIFFLPLLLVSALFNAAFNHRGITILAYFPNGNPLTRESLVYGAAAACMLVSVLWLCACLNKVMTGDKLMVLFGRLSPALSLVLTMTLRFVPRFTARIQETLTAQKALRGNPKGLFAKIKTGCVSLFSTIVWAIEGAIDTSDSMKSRGFGAARRTCFSPIRWQTRDTVALCWLLLAGGYALYARLSGAFSFSYFPRASALCLSGKTACAAAFYALFLLTPIFIEGGALRQWKRSRSAM